MVKKRFVENFPERNPQKIQQATLCYLVRGKGKKREILLAMKKRSFGKGFWNGSGGKPEPKESIKRCLLREVGEEVGVKIDIKRVKRVALLHFYFPKLKSAWDQDVHVFLAEKWQGRPKETEEMRPKWFKIADLPYSKMWPDDPFWLPLVLNDKQVEGSFRFKNNGEVGFYNIGPYLTS
jgi:8-oxo-dGTP pyrophosphatase MutT (NUDIX family)